MNKRKNIKKEMLEKIRKNEVKMKPKWWFEMIEGTEKSGVILLLLLGAILVATGIYIFWLIDPREFINYGDVGIEVLLENISYEKLLGGLLLAIVGGVIYSKIGTNYKKSWGKKALIILGILAGLVVVTTMVRIILEL